MIPKTIPFLFTVLLLFLSSCSQSLPDRMPNIGINIDELELNTYIRLATPKECNTYKTGNEVCLDINNLSEKTWTFSILKDILIYQYENKEWKKIPEKMENIGATELGLGPKGEFPLDSRVVGVLPNVRPDQPSYLRIFIIVHEQTLEKGIQSKGAFVDVLLRP